jgi:hypothetical protein
MNSRPILKGLDFTESLVIRVPMVAFESFQRTPRLRHYRWLWQLRLLHPMHFAGLESNFLYKSSWEAPRCLPTARQRGSGLICSQVIFVCVVHRFLPSFCRRLSSLV